MMDICCLCLKNNISYSLLDIDNNITYYEKLSTFLSDLVRMFYCSCVRVFIFTFVFKFPKPEQLKICQKCREDINSTYEFRNRCIKNISIYKTYMSNLDTFGVKRSDECVQVSHILKDAHLESNKSSDTLLDREKHVKEIVKFDNGVKVENKSGTNKGLEDAKVTDFCENELAQDVAKMKNICTERKLLENERISNIPCFSGGVTGKLYAVLLNYQYFGFSFYFKTLVFLKKYPLKID